MMENLIKKIMKIRTKHLKHIAGFFSALLFSILFFLNPKLLSAQSEIPLTVAPARQYLKANPGEKIQSDIKFFNHSNIPIPGEIKIVDFVVQGDSGAPVLLEDTSLSTRFSAASWVKTDYSKAIIAGESVLTIPFTIDVPSDARPGGRYFAVIFEASNPELLESNSDNLGFSSVSPRIVGLVSIKIDGVINEAAFIEVFRVPVFLQFGPVEIDFEILNNGDYHITPKGKAILTDWFNKEIDYKELEEKNIFPDTKRSYNYKLGDRWMFGKYKVELIASYGERATVMNTSKYIWIIPLMFIAVIVLGAIIIILTTVLIVKIIKRKQTILENKLEEEINELENLKSRFKDRLPK